MHLLAAVVVLGFLIWGVHWLFTIRIPMGRGYLLEAVTYIFDETGHLYSTFFAPVFCVALICLALWFFVVGVIRFRQRGVLLFLTILALLFPAVYLLHYTFGIILFSWLYF